MASSGILVFIFTALCVAAVKSGRFINVECKVENVGFHGQQSLLECIIRRTKDVHDPIIRVVSWKKLTSPKDENSLPLLVFAKGKLEKMPGYRFADPYWDEKNMNVSLLITKTAVADEGLYNCMVITDSGDDKAVTTLKVQAFPGFINVECKAENVGHHGQQSLLECIIRTTKDVQDPTIWMVAWKKLITPEDSDGLTVFTYARGELDQKSGYRFAETSWNEKNMNVSLLITNTAVADNGVYRCTVITDSGNHTSVTTLKVHEAGGAPGLGHTPRVAALLVGIGLLIVEWLVALLFYRR